MFNFLRIAWVCGLGLNFSLVVRRAPLQLKVCQARHEITQKSSEIVPLGAPVFRDR